MISAKLKQYATEPAPDATTACTCPETGNAWSYSVVPGLEYYGAECTYGVLNLGRSATNKCTRARADLATLPTAPDRTYFAEAPFRGSYEEGVSQKDIAAIYYKRFSQAAVTYEYPLSAFRWFYDILNYQRAFVTGERRPYDPPAAQRALDEEVFPSFCAFPSDACPDTSPCSRFVSVDPEGDQCRAWAAREPARADAVKVEYCHRPTSVANKECQCINAIFDPYYLLFKQDLAAPDGCWYAPCANTTEYLVPSTEALEAPCPDVCGIILKNYNIGKESNIKYTADAVATIACLRSTDAATSPSPTGGFFGGGAEGFFAAATSPAYLPYTIAAAAVVGLILLVALGYAIKRSTSRGSSPRASSAPQAPTTPAPSGTPRAPPAAAPRSG